MATIVRSGDDDVYTSREVADLFGVSVQTVWRWAEQDRLDYGRTPGGIRRYPARTVNELLRTRGLAAS